jgi:hypothetical protein
MLEQRPNSAVRGRRVGTLLGHVRSLDGENTSFLLCTVTFKSLVKSLDSYTLTWQGVHWTWSRGDLELR